MLSILSLMASQHWVGEGPISFGYTKYDINQGSQKNINGDWVEGMKIGDNKIAFH